MGSYIHEAGHVVVSLLIALAITGISWIPLLGGLFGGLLPDIDKLFYYMYHRKKFKSFSFYLRWLARDMNHKKINVAFHNVYVIIILLFFILLVRNISLQVFFLAFACHLLYDIIDDIIYMRTVSHWFTLKKEFQLQ